MCVKLSKSNDELLNELTKFQIRVIVKLTDRYCLFHHIPPWALGARRALSSMQRNERPVESIVCIT